MDEVEEEEMEMEEGSNMEKMKKRKGKKKAMTFLEMPLAHFADLGRAWKTIAEKKNSNSNSNKTHNKHPTASKTHHAAIITKKVRSAMAKLGEEVWQVIDGDVAEISESLRRVMGVVAAKRLVVMAWVKVSDLVAPWMGWTITVPVVY